jgi:hypothetical protein
MTPKEALKVFQICSTYVEVGAEAFEGDADEALSEYVDAILTVVHYLFPRTEPPTVEEVRDNEQCLVVHLNGFVGVDYGKYLRRKWQNGMQWLPIPEVAV